MDGRGKGERKGAGGGAADDPEVYAISMGTKKPVLPLKRRHEREAYSASQEVPFAEYIASAVGLDLANINVKVHGPLYAKFVGFEHDRTVRAAWIGIVARGKLLGPIGSVDLGHAFKITEADSHFLIEEVDGGVELAALSGGRIKPWRIVVTEGEISPVLLRTAYVHGHAFLDLAPAPRIHWKGPRSRQGSGRRP